MRKGRSIPGVKRVRSKGREYYYFDTGQKHEGRPVYARLPDVKDRAFGAVYAQLTAARTRRHNAGGKLTLVKMIALYEASQKFRAMKASSQKNYSLYLAKLGHAFNTAPADALERKDVLDLVDGMADRPGAANLLLAVTRALYAWARRRGHVAIDPCKDIDRMDLGEHQPWPDAILDEALGAQDARVRLATSLLYYTAQRIGDVVAMRWSDIRGDTVHVVQEKTGKKMAIRLHRDLAALLESTPKRGLTIIATEKGRKRSQEAVRKELQKFAADRGYVVVPHGLRKNAVNSLLEAGCSTAETAAISGQSLQMVEHYAKARDTEALGSAAILRWETKTGTGKPKENRA